MEDSFFLSPFSMLASRGWFLWPPAPADKGGEVRHTQGSKGGVLRPKVWKGGLERRSGVMGHVMSGRFGGEKSDEKKGPVGCRFEGEMGKLE